MGEEEKNAKIQEIDEVYNNINNILENFTPDVIAQMTDEQLAEFEELLERLKKETE